MELNKKLDASGLACPPFIPASDAAASAVTFAGESDACRFN